MIFSIDFGGIARTVPGRGADRRVHTADITPGVDDVTSHSCAALPLARNVLDPAA
jgi:hypothetical protein